MQLTARLLNRATLHRQLLLAREPLSAPHAVERIFAVQAQEPASPYLSLWNRVTDFDASGLDRSFVTREVVKSTLLRVTLHAMTAPDHAAVYAAMLPRLRARLHDPRFRALGVSPDDADAALADLADFLVEPRGNAEIEAVLAERFGELPKPGLWWALRTFGPVHHAPSGAPWTFGPRPAYVAAPPGEAIDEADAVRHYVARYLSAFGPATVADIAQFSLLLRPSLRDALADVATDEYRGPGGEVLYDLRGTMLPDEHVAAPPRLLGMWDSVLLAHADRSRIIPDEYRPHVIRRNGDTLATVLVDGYVAGAWRATPDGIEIGAFHPWPEQVWRDLAAEAERLRAFLADRDPEVYRRYARWWQTLPLTASQTI